MYHEHEKSSQMAAICVDEEQTFDQDECAYRVDVIYFVI